MTPARMTKSTHLCIPSVFPLIAPLYSLLLLGLSLLTEKRRLKNILSAPIVRAPAPPPAAVRIPTFGNVAAALLDNIMGVGRTPSAALGGFPSQALAVQHTSMPAKTESNARWHQAATECLKNFDLYLKGKNPLTAAQIKSIRER